MRKHETDFKREKPNISIPRSLDNYFSTPPFLLSIATSNTTIMQCVCESKISACYMYTLWPEIPFNDHYYFDVSSENNTHNDIIDQLETYLVWIHQN